MFNHVHDFGRATANDQDFSFMVMILLSLALVMINNHLASKRSSGYAYIRLTSVAVMALSYWLLDKPVIFLLVPILVLLVEGYRVITILASLAIAWTRKRMVSRKGHSHFNPPDCKYAWDTDASE